MVEITPPQAHTSMSHVLPNDLIITSILSLNSFPHLCKGSLLISGDFQQIFSGGANFFFPFSSSSVTCLSFLRQDGGCQLLSIGDVRAPGHHPADELRGEYVAEVDVHLLPQVLVVAVCRGL